MIAERNHPKRVQTVVPQMLFTLKGSGVHKVNPAGCRVDCRMGSRMGCQRDCVARGMFARRAFTIFELLVVISIVAILGSMLMPALSRARAAAGRIQCASNFRQIGCAITEYQGDRNDALPPLSATSNQATAQWGEAMAITNPSGTRLEGLGLLVKLRYLSDARLLYCPCHRGEHAFETYESRLAKSEFNLGGGGPIYSNYHYRSAKDPLSTSTYGTLLKGNLSAKVLVVDGMRTKLDFNHITGTNRLKGDGSVDWRLDAGNAIYRSLPTGTQNSFTGGEVFQTAWRWIDEKVEEEED